MKQARHLGGDDVVGSCCDGVLYFSAGEIGADGFVEIGEKSAESAAYLGLLHLDYFESFDSSQKLSWLLIEA